MNELAENNLAETLRCADIESVRLGIGSESRIGYASILSGVGYGAALVFSQDVQALKRSADGVGYTPGQRSGGGGERQQPAYARFVHKIKKSSISVISNKARPRPCGGAPPLSFSPIYRMDMAGGGQPRLDGVSSGRPGAKVRAYDPVAMPEVPEAIW